jgi:hypothetical protein
MLAQAESNASDRAVANVEWLRSEFKSIPLLEQSSSIDPDAGYPGRWTSKGFPLVRARGQ